MQFTENMDIERRKVFLRNLETSYSPEDFVNPDDYDSTDPKQKAYVVLSAGFVLGIAFAEYPAYTESDALNEMADSGKLDGYQLDETELADYQVGTDSEGNPEYEGVANLGNAGEPFAVDDTFAIWIFNAFDTFGEDTALMRPDRVMTRLEAARDAADSHYKTVPVQAPNWSSAYRAVTDLEDAITLARLQIAR